MGSLHKLVSFVAILCFFALFLDASICRYTHYQSMLFVAAKLLSRYIAHRFRPPSPLLCVSISRIFADTFNASIALLHCELRTGTELEVFIGIYMKALVVHPLVGGVRLFFCRTETVRKVVVTTVNITLPQQESFPPSCILMDENFTGSDRPWHLFRPYLSNSCCALLYIRPVDMLPNMLDLRYMFTNFHSINAHYSASSPTSPPSPPTPYPHRQLPVPTPPPPARSLSSAFQQDHHPLRACAVR